MMFMILKLSSATLRAGVFFLLTVLSASAGEGDILFRWTNTFLKSVRQDSTPPGQVSRRLAILYLAAHDAHAFGKDAFFPETPITKNLDREAAAIGALNAGARILYPSHKAVYLTDLRDFKRKRLDQGLPAKTLTASLAYGEKVVFHLIKMRADDGATNTRTYIPSGDPGRWRRTPPGYRPPELSHWGKVKPFLLNKASQFRSPPPPALDSKAYREALEEVRKVGGSSVAGRPKKDDETAHFWSCFSYTATPSGHWNTILTDLLSKDEKITLEKALDAFVVLNITLADTAIACWDTKYHYNFWRPEDAIHHAVDIHWNPLLESPPHPEYVSGHSSFAGAGARIFELIFGSDKASFEAKSDSLPDVIRKYESFHTCAAEMGHSRILGGIHFPFSDKEGQKLGRKVADHCWQKLREK